MARWIKSKSNYGASPSVDAFIEELLAVCRKHGFALAHEDTHGAFEIVKLEEGDLDWLQQAHDDTN